MVHPLASIYEAIDRVTQAATAAPNVVVMDPRAVTLIVSTWLVWTARRALSGRRRVTADDLRRMDERHGAGLMTPEAIPRALRILRRAENRRRRRRLKKRGWR